MRLALDHHYSHQIAEQLRARGHDVVAVYERGWHRLGDEELLDRCVAEARTLLTNNVSDFVGLSQQWAGQGRYHAGLVFTADASLPRTLATIGRYVELLEALLTDNPGDTDFIGRIHWL